MTTHLSQKSRFASLAGKMVPACRQGSVRGAQGWYDMTEDRSKVDCKRCAKAEGFAPAVKASANPGGTCQVCFAQQRVMGGQTMAIHGYTRPGCGYIIGDCRGSKHLPFEKDCTVTKSHRVGMSAHLAGLQAELERLQTPGAVKAFNLQVETRVRNPEFRFGGTASRYVKEEVVIKLGDERRTDMKFIHSYIPSFADCLKREIWDVEGKIRATVNELAFLDEKIAGWSVKELLP
jgi:hypothetical protein